MIRGALLDSSVLIAAERKRIDVERFALGQSDVVAISVVTASELLHGVHRTSDLRRRESRSAFVEWVLATFAVLDIDVSAARVHARLWADLASRGQMIGPHDLWIAASGIAAGFKLVTTNLREFSRIPDLAVEFWEEAGP